jgi:hypothetical protein
MIILISAIFVLMSCENNAVDEGGITNAESLPSPDAISIAFGGDKWTVCKGDNKTAYYEGVVQGSTIKWTPKDITDATYSIYTANNKTWYLSTLTTANNTYTVSPNAGTKLTVDLTEPKCVVWKKPLTSEKWVQATVSADKNIGVKLLPYVNSNTIFAVTHEVRMSFVQFGKRQPEIKDIKIYYDLRYSSNGSAWTSFNENMFKLNPVNAITACYIDNSADPNIPNFVLHYVVVCKNGVIAYGPTDLSNWTVVSQTLSGYSDINAATATSPLLTGTSQTYGVQVVAVGDNGKIVYFSHLSPDSSDDKRRQEWKQVEEKDNPFGNEHINAIAYGKGKFIAVGNSGKIAYASSSAVKTWTKEDVITWMEVVSPDNPFEATTDNITAIAFGGDIFLAGSSNGKIASSTDGIKWEDITGDLNPAQPEN